MNILEQIRKELPWLEDKVSYDLTRGKPSSDQLDISQQYLEKINQPYHMDGVDIRNYGLPEGLPSAKALGADIMGTSAEETLALDNSSLSLMQQILSCGYFLGFDKAKLDQNSKFICPVPGYDRHFKLLENFGFEMISIPFADDGPDLQALAQVLEQEANVAGIVCVPRHSNPTGHSYSDANVSEMFKLISQKKDNFMILWDNAYACHDLKPTIKQSSANEIAKNCGVWDNLFHLSSTSKITLAGSGIAFLSMSSSNINQFIDYRNSVTPGPNKMNQGLHVEYFKTISVEEQMNKLKEVILPKFELTEQYLSELQQEGLCEYKSPTGGYFFTFDSTSGKAKEIIDHCDQLGLKLLPLGSCHPNGIDSANRTIRIAPTFPDLQSLERCMQIFSKVVKYLN